MVQIYIGQKRIDLYGDEKITLTTKLNDIEKLSNVFTDFTQPFTVPATDNNNDIFNHYYDLDIDNSFNANVRVPGYIEYNTLPFRTGNIQLESVKMKDHKPSSYKITFYGDLKQLNDLFGEDTLNQLDNSINGTESFYTSLSQFDYSYNSSLWNQSLYFDDGLGLDGHLITPLIAVTDRDWNYGGIFGASPSFDISGLTGSIKDSEVRPALRVIKIIEAIETKYGIELGRSFFGSAVFQNLFLWLNKKEKIEFIQTTIGGYNSFVGATVGSFQNNDPFLSARRTDPLGTYQSELTFTWELDVNTAFSNVVYDLRIVDIDGVIKKEKIDLTGNNTIDYTYIDLDGNPGTPRVNVELVILPQSAMIGNIDVNVFQIEIDEFGDPPGPYEIFIDVDSIGSSYSISSTFSVGTNMVDMPVIEFVQSIMKMFKLVVRPTTTSIFDFQTLNDFYKGGTTWNLTEYIDNDTVEIERPSIFSEIDFHFEKTDNVAGKFFRETFDPFFDKTGYGDLSGKFDVDSKEKLSIEVPFENMLFERLDVFGETGSKTNILIGQSIELGSDKTTLTPRKSNPILFFNNGIVNIVNTPIEVSFQGENLIPVLSYMYLIGNIDDELSNQVTQTINFGAEKDPWLNEVKTESLFKNFWEDWVTDIYDLKQRKVKMQAILPANIISELSLDDRIVVGTNRYKISDFKIELLSGETILNLFNDIFEQEEDLTIVDTTEIVGNPGKKYYGININNIDIDEEWTAVKIATGDQNFWVTLETKFGTGPSEVVFFFNEKLSQNIPDLYLSREMEIWITVKNIIYKVPLKQNPIFEIF